MCGGSARRVALGLLVGAAGTARAEESLSDAPIRLSDAGLRLEDAWPAPPPSHRLALDQQLVDRVTELGNRAADRLDVLSHDTVGLRIDGRHQRAHLRLEAGAGHYLAFRMNEDIHLGHGTARIASVVDIDLHGHCVHLALPDVELAPTTYQSDRGVEVRVPLYERRW